nr:radical SAM protein [Lachnospiraceae bacterium]
GSMILSVGSYGCNLKCPFCQNVDISMADGRDKPYAEYVAPETLCELALKYKDKGNIGVAYTYNEPLVSYEYVRDAAKLVQEAGLINVLVTNGSVGLNVLEELAAYVDAMNIDLKCFNDKYYRDVLKGDFEAVKSFITRAAEFCHVELTTLIIPGENDSDEEMEELSEWVHEQELKAGKEIPLHITRFFPRSRYSDRQPTKTGRVYELAAVARRRLKYVYEGNV